MKHFQNRDLTHLSPLAGDSQTHSLERGMPERHRAGRLRLDSIFLRNIVADGCHVQTLTNQDSVKQQPSSLRGSRRERGREKKTSRGSLSQDCPRPESGSRRGYVVISWASRPLASPVDRVSCMARTHGLSRGSTSPGWSAVDGPLVKNGDVGRRCGACSVQGEPRQMAPVDVLSLLCLQPFAYSREITGEP